MFLLCNKLKNNLLALPEAMLRNANFSSANSGKPLVAEFAQSPRSPMIHLTLPMETRTCETAAVANEVTPRARLPGGSPKEEPPRQE